MRTGANISCSRVRGESRHHPGKRVSNRRILACSGRKTTAVFARGVLCTFWPQKVPKTPRQMPAPTSSRLTLAPGDYSRGRTRPVPFARAFSRAFVSRLRHRAGIGPGSFAAIPSFRPGKEANTRTCEQGRTSLVRVFAENPGIAPGSGFKPPHSRLQRRKHRI